MATNNDDKISDLALKIGGAVAAYLIIVKPIISTFGATPEQKAAIESVDQLTPEKNPFNAQYLPMQNFFNDAYQRGATNGMELGDYIHFKKQDWDDLDPKPAITWHGSDYDPITAAEIIKDAFSFWNVHITGNNSDIMGIFNTVQTKQEVAGIAAVLWELYNIDLWTFLKEGGSTMWRGLSPSDLKLIVDRINVLPDSN